MDPWYSLGKADLVDAAHLALHFTYMSGREEIPEMLRCATERGARTLGVEDEYGHRARASPPTASSSTRRARSR